MLVAELKGIFELVTGLVNLATVTKHAAKSEIAINVVGALH